MSDDPTRPTNDSDTPPAQAGTDALPASNDPSTPPADGEFGRLAEGERPGFFGELWDFLKHNKKWWLLPILLLMGVFGLLVFLAGTGLAPFLYPLF